MACIVESVVNISEGRNPGLIRDLMEVVRESRAWLLDVHADQDHNRSVFTVAGGPEEVVDAVCELAGMAVKSIDLRFHQGVHPRIGAVDVIPFTPLQGISLADCLALAERCGERLWQSFGLPVFFYGESSRREGRKELSAIRRGGFEALRLEVRENPAFAPDKGDRVLHETAGAVAVGARPVLIAFNVRLKTQDLSLARQIAAGVREKGHGLPGVRALGFFLESRQSAQISMNLVDYRTTGPLRALERVCEICEQHRVGIFGTEIVGLLPQSALPPDPSQLLLEASDPLPVLERRLWEAMGLWISI